MLLCNKLGGNYTSIYVFARYEPAFSASGSACLEHNAVRLDANEYKKILFVAIALSK
jgi:hypothetical protein